MHRSPADSRCCVSIKEHSSGNELWFVSSVIRYPSRGASCERCIDSSVDSSRLAWYTLDFEFRHRGIQNNEKELRRTSVK